MDGNFREVFAPAPVESNEHLLHDAGFLVDRGYVEELPVLGLDAKDLLGENTSASAGLSGARDRAGQPLEVWYSAHAGASLECAGKESGFGLSILGLPVFRTLHYTKSKSCEARQLVEATCEYADVLGRSLARKDESARVPAGQQVVRATAICVSSMKQASAALLSARAEAQQRLLAQAQADKAPQCLTSNDRLLRNMFQCDI
jgi:hypothetical protein